MRLKVRWLNSALIASKPRAIAMIGVTSPTMPMNENGIGSGEVVNSRRNRNGLCPMLSRIVVVENQARTSATRNTSASITTIRGPLRWSAVSLATTVPSPVQGEPRRRRPGASPGRLLSGIAGLLEIAGVDLVEARRGETDAGHLDHRGELAGDLGAQVGRGRRLVKDRDARPLHQHLGQTEPLAHALGEGAHPVAADIAEPDPIHRGSESFVHLVPRQAGEAAGIGEVVARREAVIKA